MALKRTKEPGVFYDDVLNKFVKIVEWKVDDRYDTVVTAAGAITAGTQKNFWRTLSDKDNIDGNFPQAGKVLGTGEEMILERVGMHIPLAVGNTIIPPTDIKKAAEGFYVELKINRDPIASGPAIRFPSGYGLAGQTTDNAAGVITNGVPSTAAAAKLARPHDLQSTTDVAALGTWYDHVWDATNMPTLVGKVWHKLHLHGLIKAAATRAG